MLTFADWSLAISDAITSVITRVINFVPNLLGAVVIIMVGWAIAAVLEWVVDSVLRSVGLQTLFERARIEDIVKKAETGRDTTSLLGAVAKWVIILVAFIAAADTLNLNQVASFLDRVLGFVPNVVSAALILLVGAIFAHFMSRVIKGSVQAARLHFGDLASSVARYAILVFTFLAALDQLGIASNLIQTLFTGFVAMVAIAGGLAFGLGGQSVAKDLLERFRKELQVK